MTRPVLVLLNGAPASGKSTLARAWAQRHGADLPLALDIDVLRSMLGGWLDAPGDAGLAARAVAVAGIAAHLSSGRDVLVPQLLVRPAFIDELREVAVTAQAHFVECVVAVDPAEAAGRFERRQVTAGRSRDPYSPVVHGGLEASMADMVAAVESIASRTETVRLSGTLDDMVDQLDAAVARVRG